MPISFSRIFVKQYKKAPLKIRLAFDQRLKLFLKNSHHFLLNDHFLRGKLKGYKSINITGDWRALYSQLHPSIIIFEALGTHNQLYK